MWREPCKVRELYHYGVKGMKWGVRHDREVLGRKFKYSSPTSQKVKAAIIDTLIQIPLSLIPIPGLSLLFSAGEVAKNASIQFDRTDYVSKDGPIEKLSELPKKTKQTSVEEDVKQINKGHKGKRGGSNNCVYCTAAMEMRRRGYDVSARRKSDGTDVTEFSKWFKNAKIETINTPKIENESRKNHVSRAYDNVCTKMESYGKGARGHLSIQYEKLWMGHSLFWEVDGKGVAHIYDGQAGKSKNDDLFSMSDPNVYDIIRLDNLELNESVTKTCKSSRKK